MKANNWMHRFLWTGLSAVALLVALLASRSDGQLPPEHRCTAVTNRCEPSGSTCRCPGDGQSCPESRIEFIQSVIRDVSTSERSSEHCMEKVNGSLVCYKLWDCTDGGELNCLTQDAQHPDSCSQVAGQLLHTEEVNPYWVDQGDCSNPPCHG